MSGSELLIAAVRVAGALHLVQLPAMRVASGVLGWPNELAKLRPVNRMIVRVIGLAIIIAMSGLGVVMIIGAPDIARGGRLAVALTAFAASFVGFRAWVQWRVYGPLLPGRGAARVCHRALGLMFTIQSLVYASACFCASVSIR